MSQAHDDIIGKLSESANPIIRYKLRRYVLGEEPGREEMRRLRTSIKDTPIALFLLRPNPV